MVLLHAAPTPLPKRFTPVPKPEENRGGGQVSTKKRPLPGRAEQSSQPPSTESMGPGLRLPGTWCSLTPDAPKKQLVSRVLSPGATYCPSCPARGAPAIPAPRPRPPLYLMPGLCRLSASRGVSEPLREHGRLRAPGSAAGTRAAPSHAGAREPPPPPFRCRRWGEGDAAAPPRAAAGGRGLLSGAARLSLPLARRGRLGPARVGEGSSRLPRARAAQDLRGLPAQISPDRGRGPRPTCPTCSGPRRRLARGVRVCCSNPGPPAPWQPRPRPAPAPAPPRPRSAAAAPLPGKTQRTRKSRIL